MSRKETTRIRVEGMTCGSCVRHIREAIGGLDGVEDVNVSLATREVFVQHDPAMIPVARLVQSLSDAGYDGRPSS